MLLLVDGERVAEGDELVLREKLGDAVVDELNEDDTLTEGDRDGRARVVPVGEPRGVADFLVLNDEEGDDDGAGVNEDETDGLRVEEVVALAKPLALGDLLGERVVDELRDADVERDADVDRVDEPLARSEAVPRTLAVNEVDSEVVVVLLPEELSLSVVETEGEGEALTEALPLVLRVEEGDTLVEGEREGERLLEDERLALVHLEDETDEVTAALLLLVPGIVRVEVRETDTDVVRDTRGEEDADPERDGLMLARGDDEDEGHGVMDAEIDGESVGVVDMVEEAQTERDTVLLRLDMTDMDKVLVGEGVALKGTDFEGVRETNVVGEAEGEVVCEREARGDGELLGVTLAELDSEPERDSVGERDVQTDAELERELDMDFSDEGVLAGVFAFVAAAVIVTVLVTVPLCEEQPEDEMDNVVFMLTDAVTDVERDALVVTHGVGESVRLIEALLKMELLPQTVAEPVVESEALGEGEIDTDGLSDAHIVPLMLGVVVSDCIAQGETLLLPPLPPLPLLTVRQAVGDTVPRGGVGEREPDGDELLEKDADAAGVLDGEPEILEEKLGEPLEEWLALKTPEGEMERAFVLLNAPDVL